MFKLLTEEGTALLMKNGEPFIYTNKKLAQMGKKFIEADRKVTLKIVPSK